MTVDLDRAVAEAAINAAVVLESRGVPVPADGEERVVFLESLRDGIAALVDRLSVVESVG